MCMSTWICLYVKKIHGNGYTNSSLREIDTEEQNRDIRS